MEGQYFQTPGVVEILKGIWPWFWGLNKMLWPIWVLIAILVIIKYGSYFLGKKIDQKVLERIKKKCGDCAEWVPKEAKKCSHCGKAF
jgi:hypothetical protein